VDGTDNGATADGVSSEVTGKNEPSGAKGGNDGNDGNGATEFTKAVQKSILAVRERIASDPESAVDPDDPMPDVKAGSSVSVSDAIADDTALGAASRASDSPAFHEDPRLSDIARRINSVKIEQHHKDEFVESIITGRRYVETFDLFGGRVKLSIRSRSSYETEAMTAYARRMVITDKVRTDYDYSCLMRKLMAVAQVEEFNGVKYPEMQEPLFFTETEKELIPPGWEGSVKLWGDKPEAVLTAVMQCILEFETRYWNMVRKVNDRDFWAPAESTGK